jgi:hypothetical protein
LVKYKLQSEEFEKWKALKNNFQKLYNNNNSNNVSNNTLNNMNNNGNNGNIKSTMAGQSNQGNSLTVPDKGSKLGGNQGYMNKTKSFNRSESKYGDNQGGSEVREYGRAQGLESPDRTISMSR